MSILYEHRVWHTLTIIVGEAYGMAAAGRRYGRIRAVWAESEGRQDSRMTMTGLPWGPG